MKNNYILVTGGAGYIGSVCTELLLKRGFRAVVIDNLKTGSREAVEKKAIFIKGDIGDKALLDGLFRKYGFYAVIHFAAETLVDNATKHPDWYYVNNLQNGIELLEAMRRSNCRKIIFSSSAAVYGNPKSFPIGEHDETKPLNPYGYTKLVFEKILQDYAMAFEFKYTIFRYFNPAGATRLHGELHNPETHIIPLVLQAVKRNKTVSIFGDNYPTKDGTCVRDYLHVVDVAQAHILALRDISVHPNSVYNLGSEKGFTVKEVVKTAEKVTSRNVKVKIVGRRPGDPAVLVASSKRARKILRWKPKYGDLKTIISSAWRFESRRSSKS